MSRRSRFAAAASLAALIAQLQPATAADLLRRGAGSSSGNGATGASGETDSATGTLRDQTLVNNREALARTNRTLQDLARLQTAARAAALGGAATVPNGLTPGGLVVAPGATPGSALWNGAAAPTQSVLNGLTKVRVSQTAPQALLTWQTFNIGRETELTFDQSAGGADRAKWIVFNQIEDPSGSPSQILGSLKADGQVYVINRNGVVFGGTSQVNVRGLTVSTLPINQNLVDQGLLNNPDGQFLFSGLAQAAGPAGTPAIAAPLPPVSTGRFGDIVIEAGAVLESPLNSDGGGRIALIGANVRNDGVIKTPEGQTILAAGLEVGLAAHDSADASLRGLDIYVGQVGDYAGSVVNNGIVETDRGNATLAGREITVAGAITSTTSVDLNGRIDLLASYGATSNPETSNSSGAGHPYFLQRETGSVTLGEAAVLRVLPELDSKDTVAATELALRSQVNLRGRTIHLEESSTILAPSALVNLDAGVWRVTPSPPYAANFINADGHIQLDSDALISVAGSAGVVVPVSQNIVAVEVRGAELADSPLQRNGFLRGVTIYVDIRETGTLDGRDWIGTPLVDASGYVGLIQRGVGQLTVDAGKVNLRAGGAVVMQDQATIDVSSGWIDYQGGTVRTTRLFKDGRLIDIADAIPTVTYDGVYTGTTTVFSERWGISSTYTHPIAAFASRYEEGYTHGASGGQVTLLASAMALDGVFRGYVTTGERQRELADQPDQSGLTLDFTTRDLAYNPAFPVVAPTAPRVVFTDEEPASEAPDFTPVPGGGVAPLPEDRVAQVNIDPNLLTSSGLGGLTINNPEGDILLPENAVVTGTLGASISLTGRNVTIAGDIDLPGGSIGLAARNVSLDTIAAVNRSSEPVNPSPASGRGSVIVAAGARLDVSGRVVNEFAGDVSSLPAARHGGSITISGFDVSLGAGSVLDVSGAYHVASDGSVAAGDAGSISLSAGRDPVLTSVLGGSLSIDGAVLLGHADASASSGSLTILAPAVRIGTGSGDDAAGVLRLASSFFNQGGFSTFDIGGIGISDGAGGFLAGVALEQNEFVSPRVGTLRATLIAETGALEIALVEEAAGVRPAADITLRAVGATDAFAGGQVIVRGGVEIAEGATLATEAGGSLALVANTIDLQGNLVARGGDISIRGGNSFASVVPDTTRALPTVLVGEHARIDASGAVVLTPNALGLRTGEVLRGGSVSVSGNIVIQEGSVIDVSGAESTLDLAPNFAPGGAAGQGLRAGAAVPVRVATSGGSITLSGSQLLAADGSLIARAGGDGAGGGSLSVSSGRFYANGETSTTADRTLVVRQSGASFDSAAAGLGMELLDADGSPIRGGGSFSIEHFTEGGFDDLALSGNVSFVGEINIAARGRVRLADGGVIQADDRVTIDAGYIGVGQDFVAPSDPSQSIVYFTQNVPGVGQSEYKLSASHGSGSLEFSAGLVDIGTLSLQQIGSAAFTASGGDLRGNGYLDIAGRLTLAAGQIYPTTGSAFTVTASDYVADGASASGSIAIRQDGARPDLPASAGGTLSLYASDIQQSGTLRAPFGTINLGRGATDSALVNPVTGLAAPVADSVTLTSGSLTSVSALRADGSAATLPYGVILNGTSWIDPRGVDITLDGLPEKNVVVAGAGIVTEDGSVIDVRGGGDLLAYRFIPGNGGSQDLLGMEGSFAIIPGDQSIAAPYAPFNPTPATNNLGGDAGYVNDTLNIGDQVWLDAAAGLPAGTYTLLPARYAILPGAFLVTPVATPPPGSTTLPDGSGLVAGYRFDGITGAVGSGLVLSGFEIAPQTVVRQRAEYSTELASTFLREAAESSETSVPRLPVDAGRLVFSADDALEIAGSVSSARPAAGRGAEIDISSSRDIRIGASGSAPVDGALNLDASGLGSFGAASLLIGGTRSSAADGSVVTPSTRNLTLDNAGDPLVGADIILVARENLVVAAGADIRSTAPSAGSAVSLSQGSTSVAGSGDGALLRVTSATDVAFIRAGLSAAPSANLTISDGALLQGGGVLIDSAGSASISEEAGIAAKSVSLNSGRISLVLDGETDSSTAGGLVLGGDILDSILSSAESLSLLSYSSIDLYGSGVIGSDEFESLSINAPVLRRIGSGDAAFAADSIYIGNLTMIDAPAAGANPLSGALSFTGGTVTLGAGEIAVQGFENTLISAESKLVLADTGGFASAGDVVIDTPLISGLAGADQYIRSGASLRLSTASPAPAASASEELGASLSLSGADVELDSTIRLTSGRVEVEARDGDISVGGSIDVSGTSRHFFDQTRVSDGGHIVLTASQGSVSLASGSLLDISAPSAVGNAGELSITSLGGPALLNGTLVADGAGRGGSFALDTSNLAATASLDSLLNAAGFSHSREYRVRSGNVAVDGSASAASYRLQADGGSVLVSGVIDASGDTGGDIDISASGSLTLAAGAVLDASARIYDNAGKGGAISLAAGSHVDGVVPSTARLALETGSRIELSVADARSGDESRGLMTGTLRLRAPVTTAGTDIQADAIGSTINGASYVSLEGYRVYDLTASGGTITTAVQNQVRTDGQALLGAAGATTAGYTAMRDRLLALQPDLGDSLVLRTGAEIINRTGNLTLGTTSSTATSDWNLATFRFGPTSAAGVLTLRAAGDIVLNNALSDGFSGGSSLWLSPLMAYNAALPVNLQSWDLRLTAGADLGASDFRTTLSESALSASTGNVLIGKNTGAALVSGGSAALTSTLIANNFQVLRTGSGDIDVTAARDIRLQNPFAAIYTAGTAVANPTNIYGVGDFTLPSLAPTRGTASSVSQGSLGSLPQAYAAQYSLAGGDVTLTAGGDIARVTRNSLGQTIADTSRQLPTNWLYRRGSVDGTGDFGAVLVIGGFNSELSDPSASTSWWVDFSNFFSDVGALGGGNVTLSAGRDISNVGAAIPTNARMPSGTPDISKLVELGGGDLLVEAGRNIDGGSYYVQRGVGDLVAGDSVTTNAARSLNRGILDNLNNPVRLPEETWVPTMLFVGDAVFNVSARNDILLGPIANPHLLPQGNGNRFWYKTYFSTYGEDSAVQANALVGDVTLRNVVTLPDSNSATPILQAWLQTQNLLATGTSGAAYSQPWLRLAETNVSSFTAASTVLPASLGVTAFTGDLLLGGNFNLFPSASGTIELLAAGDISAISPVGRSSRLVSGSSVTAWQSSRINLSDADPASIPGIASPYSFYAAAGSPTGAGTNNTTPLTDFLQTFSRPFAETGATNTVLQTRQILHAAGLLHGADLDPIYLYAGDGDISGLTLFSAKTARVVAERDITDVALYIQNNRDDQISVVAAGRDIIAYAPNSALRVDARSSGNALNNGQQTLAGDIQISGPGSLQVIAGRNLDLGVGDSGANGTSAGITSVGNLRNPHLPQAGADLLLAAGVGGSIGLGETAIDYAGFISEFLDPAAGPNSERYLPELAALLPSDAIGSDTWTRFLSLSAERQAELATEIFHLVLRDAGRDYNNPDAETYRNYTLGYEAIESLFPGKDWNGDISLTSRRIATAAGGDITILVPGGELTVGLPVSAQSPDQGVLTQAGGNIAIFAHGSVNVGTSRIFTLRGGDISIWSTKGDIAAGSAAKTVRSAPPTRVVIDSQSAAVETDLSGLATGGGIGVLQTVAGVEAGDVDLIAPEGTIDAGDAGIRSAGNLNLAAAAVLNAANIQTGGTSVGAPAAPAAPNLGALTSASSTTAVASGSGLTENRPEPAAAAAAARDQLPSFFSVEVLGYGGGEDEDDSARRGSS